jgi:hypothetical protein
MPVTNIPTPGSPIRSNWAQSVSTVADAALARTGGTLSGTLTVGGTPSDTVAGVAAVTAGRISSSVGTNALQNLQCVRFGPAVGVGQQFVNFVRGTVAIGSITEASSTTVAFNTTSDRRLKQRTGDAGDALDLVAALGALAYRGRWIADDDDGQEWVFVNSQDVEAVAPYAVAGDPAGTDPETGDIIPQQLDQGALVPLLLAAVAQLTARVAELEAR